MNDAPAETPWGDLTPAEKIEPLYRDMAKLRARETHRVHGPLQNAENTDRLQVGHAAHPTNLTLY